MNKYFYIILFAILSSCGDPGKDPVTLASVSDDKDLAEFLVGKWEYRFNGVGMAFYQNQLTFKSDSDRVSETSAINKYETLMSTEFLSQTYQIKIEKNIIYQSVAGGPFQKHMRIEKLGNGRMNVYDIIGTGRNESEFSAKLYTRSK